MQILSLISALQFFPFFLINFSGALAYLCQNRDLLVTTAILNYFPLIKLLLCKKFEKKNYHNYSTSKNIRT